MKSRIHSSIIAIIAAFALSLPAVSTAGIGNSSQLQTDWLQTNTGAVDYIKNKPIVPPAQVQANWNQTIATASDYILNKPTIPAAQIQANWTQTSTTALDFVKNKPTIPALIQPDWSQTNTASFDFIKNKPAIPAAQVQSDWAQSNTASLDFVKNKPTIVVPVQSDWNQTNTAALDFIKNKPVVSNPTAPRASVVTTDYTVTSADATSPTVLVFDTPTAVKLTVPDDTTVVPVGTVIQNRTVGKGQIEVATASSTVTLVTLDGANKTNGLGSQFNLVKIGANKWTVNGDLRSFLTQAYVGATVNLTCTPGAGAFPMTFQWKKAGVAISGETSKVLTFAAVALTDAGQYTCVATNPSGSAESDPYTLVVQ